MSLVYNPLGPPIDIPAGLENYRALMFDTFSNPNGKVGRILGDLLNGKRVE